MNVIILWEQGSTWVIRMGMQYILDRGLHDDNRRIY